MATSNAAILACMTAKAFIAGHVVRVTTTDAQGVQTHQLWDVAILDSVAAAAAVSQQIGAADAIVAAVEILPGTAIEELGLSAGQLRKRSLMTTRKKRPRDANQLGKSIVDIATGEFEDREPTPEEQGKDPAAVSLGRRGGLKGGQARAQKLSPKRRAAIAKKAAKSRWARRPDSEA
jgi:hypothetical protein